MPELDDVAHIAVHLKYWCKNGTPSPLAIQVCKMLAIWEAGLHHCDNSQMRKVDWTNDLWISINYQYNLATFDGAKLTRLVFLSHDFGVRVDVKPCNMRYLRLLFHQRYKREGGTCERHPTIEQALEQWRRVHATRELPSKDCCP